MSVNRERNALRKVVWAASKVVSSVVTRIYAYDGYPEDVLYVDAEAVGVLEQALIDLDIEDARQVKSLPADER